MVLTISAGYSFGVTETVTSEKLRQLIESATITKIARANLDSGFYGTTTAASEPSGLETGETWYDTDEGRLKVHDGSNAVSIAKDLEVSLAYNDPGSEGNLEAKEVVVVDTTINNTVTQTQIERDEDFVGVCLDDSVADGSSARILREGVTAVKAETGVSRGEYLHTSTNYGFATSAAGRGAGSFGIALENESGNSVQALLFGQPIASIPSGAIIMWDNSTACPSGYSEVTAARDRFARSWSGNDTMIQPIDTGGINTYSSEIFSGVVTRSSDFANATMSPALDAGIPTEAYWDAFNTPTATAGTKMLLNTEQNQASGRAGDHQHNLNGVENQPAYYAMLFCEKD